jgi:hypothetical protein
METYVIIKSGLVLHLTGIIMMIGITIASLVILQQSSKLFHGETDKALLVLKGTAAYPMLQMIGAILLLAGGVIMMIAYHGVLMHAQWFKIKMAILALIILTQLFIGRPAIRKLRKIISGYQNGKITDGVALRKSNRQLSAFNALQLLLFLFIIILSAFRFN